MAEVTTAPAAAAGPGKVVGAVVGASKVLRALHQSSKPLNASQVARAAGLYRGTAYNILRTLQSEGFVAYDEDGKTYTISLHILAMANGALRKSRVLDLVRPHMYAVAETYKVTVYTSKVVDENTSLLLLDWVGAAFRTDAYVTVGRQYPTASGAPGVVVAAFSKTNAKDLERRFARFHWYRKPSLKEFKSRVERAKADGYSIDAGDMFNGLTQVAVPILSESYEIVLALIAVGYSHELDEARLRSLTRDMMTAANRISDGVASLNLA
jgi:DNA-binding IclR family transcriptional regulator